MVWVRRHVKGGHEFFEAVRRRLASANRAPLEFESHYAGGFEPRLDERGDVQCCLSFIELFGLPLRTQARIQGALEDSVPLSLERKVKRR